MLKKHRLLVEKSSTLMRRKEFKWLLNDLLTGEARSATLFTDDGKATLKMTAVKLKNESTMTARTLVLTFGGPCYKDRQRLKENDKIGVHVSYKKKAGK